MTVGRGTNNIRNKLTEESVMEIYNSATLTQHQLAKKYGISQSAVNHIRKGRTWVWLTQRKT